MDGQQLGERFGRLEAGQEELGRRMADMQATGTKEHDEVKELLVGLTNEVAKKADKTEVKAVDEKTDANKGRLDRLAGIGVAIVVVSPFVIGELLHVVGAA